MNTDIPATTPNPAPLATSDDREHVRLLAIFHFVLAGLMSLFGCLGVVYVIMGALIATSKFEGPEPPPPPEFGWFIAGMGAFIMVLIWTIAGLIIVSGRRLLQHRSRLFCMVMAGLMCLSFPLGTILGVFTLVVLSRPGVRQLFGET